jgi:ribose 5-phosphate isomerase A
MEIETLKREAARAAAAAELRSSMRIGLGTGSTAAQFIAEVAVRIAAGETYFCVATSLAADRLARSHGISPLPLDDLAPLDLVVDGADELTDDLALIKGGGAALLREKIVAFASRRMVVIADGAKRVARLGRFPLPVEVLPFGAGTTAKAVEAAFAASGIDKVAARVRLGDGAKPLRTDNGNFILDCESDGIPDPGSLAARLDRIPGVVEHGLFIGLCHAAYIATPEGIIRLGSTP